MGEGDNGSWQLETTALSEEDRARLRSRHQSTLSLLLYSRSGIQVIPLVEGRGLVIGREPPADVPIEDESLSRQHAHLELVDGALWIEDLKSTNGTWVDGQRVKRTQVAPGAQVTFGAVTASVHGLTSDESQDLGVDSHDRLMAGLESEAARARAFGRPLALVMLRSRADSIHASRWLDRCRQRLRPFDRIALYSPDTIEVMLVETSREEARRFSVEMASGDPPLLAGVSVLPDHAGSAEELLNLTRVALLEASESTPVVTPAEPDSADLAPQAPEGDGPIVRSEAMRQVFSTVERLGSSVIPVLIVGETGTGKEIVARAIHEGGDRKKQPMRSVNCGAIPSELVESTLFGHEKGAFTGADRRAIGVFESADGGTVMLDEIGELPPAAQASLLRVLENKRITRVGGDKEIEVDTRIIAATHKNLELMVAEDTFRQDLLFRLNAMTLKVPPLRERPEEIEPLALRFMQESIQANRTKVTRFDPEALALLRHYRWPGNIRELRNAVERAVVIARDELIRVEDLPEPVRDLGALTSVPATSAPAAGGLPGIAGPINLKAELQRYEAGLILRALRQTDWDRQAAAELLGIPVRTLGHKIQVYDIKKEE